MKISYPHLPTMLFMVVFLLTFASCEKDSDLFYEAIIEQEEEIEEQSDSQDGTSDGSDNDNEANGGNSGSDGPPPPPEDPNFENTNKISGVYYPKSAADISDPNYAEYKAVINNSFDCSGCTFSENQTIEPAGGIITGTNINLNGAFIETAYKQAFSPEVTFTEIYSKSRLTPEIFGGNGGDNIADDAPILAMIRNSTYALGATNAVYIKNREDTYNRAGEFNWNMNGSIVRTTNSSNLSHGGDVSNQTKYLFKFQIPVLVLYDGEFDGQDLASRAIYIVNNERYDIRNIHVHNYLAPAGAYARGTGIKWEIGDNFVEGQFHGNVIENIGATTDGNANNAPYGIAKAISFHIKTNNESNLYFSGNRYENIYGDDAEGFINNRGSGYSYANNKTNFYFENDQFIACQRRAVKVNASNVHFNNCLFRSATNPPIFNGAQAALVNVFSISSGQEIRNIRMTNCDVEIVGESSNSAFAVTDATDAVFEYNTFSANYIRSSGSVGFAANGTQNGLYDGYLDNSVIFRNNTIENLRINLGVVYNPQNGGPIVENNIQNLTLDRSVGLYWAALRLVSTSGQSNDFTLKDHTVNVDIQSTTGLNLFGGVLNTQGSEPKNLTFDNVAINYSGGSPVYAFAYTGKNNTSADFDNSNMIKDCSISGASGNGAIFVKGSDKSVVIQNSFGDNNSAITTN
ncbi:hypothetical protein [Flagellimonas meishanensis]|uniref:hypothetical protein n=1 Tax=Flagellimonas meishanensis TaxID=2873264 RepID=UPI001CA67304|nr:hypothetical protein [[Muricauda] meishanensis]